MTEPFFHRREGPFSVAALAEALGAPVPAVNADRPIVGVAPLAGAEADQVTFFADKKLATALAATRAGACLVARGAAALVPAGTAALVVEHPHQAFLRVLALFHPEAGRPRAMVAGTGVAVGAHVAPDAELEDGVTVDPGAVVGPGARIGRGTVIQAGAVVGPGVLVGRDCSIGASSTVQHALLGDRVIVHPGARIGQDGFGYAMGPRGHAKIPQIGRVVIQNDVEIGANTCIDRGALADTVIGEGTKIDNLVQIGHNVRIGRHCVIIANAGISGSCVIGDFVVVAGGAGIADHITIGAGARLGANAGVIGDVPAGATWGGFPAQPAREWMREVATVRRLVKRRGGDTGA